MLLYGGFLKCRDCGEVFAADDDNVSRRAVYCDDLRPREPMGYVFVCPVCGRFGEDQFDEVPDPYIDEEEEEEEK